MKVVPPQPITSELSGRLGEIIAERVAGLPPEQRIDVARRTIIDVLMTQPEVPLIGLLRRHVAQELERLWLSKSELKEIHRQREQQYLESTLFLAKRGRRSSALAVVKKAVEGKIRFGGRVFRFQSIDALKQFLKRERRARKKPRP